MARNRITRLRIYSIYGPSTYKNNIIGDGNNPLIAKSNLRRATSKIWYLPAKNQEYLKFRSQYIDGREIGIAIAHQQNARAIRGIESPLK